MARELLEGNWAMAEAAVQSRRTGLFWLSNYPSNRSSGMDERPHA